MKKQHIQRLTNEELEGYERVPGIMATDDWRPFSYIALIEDYKDIIEKNLVKYGCKFKINKFSIMELQTDPRYTMKQIKFSKRDYDNFYKIACVVEGSAQEILREGGHDYKAIWDKLQEVVQELK